MKKYTILLGLIIAFGLSSCTGDFTEINKDPNAVTKEEASAKYFITNPQFQLYAPNRYPYWRAHLIHLDRYSGQVCFGNHQIWWSDELGYSYHSGYTDATWDWLAGYLGQLDNFMRLTDKGGDFENELMYATGLIMKGLYFQMYTDVFGDIPYSEAADPDITLPKFDAQKDIYKGIIADLDKAMQIIGDNERTGDGVNDLGENDLYCGGDLQKWKRLANTLKLRIALRAHGATGDDFSSNAINEALSQPILSGESDNVLLIKDEEISQWGSAAYGDIWYCCGPDGGSGWRLSKTLIDYLRDNNDPRLSLYAQPAEGGTFMFYRPDADDNQDGYDHFFDRMHFLRDVIADAIGNTDFYSEFPGDSVQFDIPANTYYIGQPTRLNADIKPYVRAEFWSKPSEWVYQKKNQGKKPFPELIVTSGEASLLKAEAIVLGEASGDANAAYQEGVRQEMKIWGASDADIDNYLATSPMGSIAGLTPDEQLERIAVQRWIGKYTDGFEAWAIVRKTGYPTQLSQGVHDPVIYGLGDINGDYPTRLRYGSAAYNTNGTNLQEAIGRQGPDVQNTKLWWQK